MFKRLFKRVKSIFPRGFYIEGNVEKNKVQIGNGAKFSDENSITFRGNASGNEISIGDGFTCKGLQITMQCSNSKLIIGNNVEYRGRIKIRGNNMTVSIGDNTAAKRVYILSREKNVTIGKNCLFSREVEIRSTDAHGIYDLGTNERLNHEKEVVIGDEVWVGARTIISKGSIIPNKSVVGAASFVNKEFDEENVVIAGSPAKIVKRNIYWKRKIS
ncbi:MAG: acyltransferase [Phaeodactylibacter sp.]|nr:acyltransferase [Phaeodactylibacter sp.]